MSAPTRSKHELRLWPTQLRLPGAASIGRSPSICWWEARVVSPGHTLRYILLDLQIEGPIGGPTGDQIGVQLGGPIGGPIGCPLGIVYIMIRRIIISTFAISAPVTSLNLKKNEPLQIEKCFAY